VRVTIQHTTRYRYETPVLSSIQVVRLTPSQFIGQTVLEWAITSDPMAPMPSSLDGFGNRTHLLAIHGAHQAVGITASGTVEVEDQGGIVRGLADLVPPRVYLRQTPLTAPSGGIGPLADALPGKETIPWLHALMTAIRDRVDYRIGVTDPRTSAADALQSGRGVCQDHAHIFIAAARHAAIPARYVTGYLLNGATGPELAHHAWAEAWVDGLGWIGFDVANRTCPTERYVRLAAALDAQYAAPIRGSRRGGERESLSVEVIVRQAAQQQQQ